MKSFAVVALVMLSVWKGSMDTQGGPMEMTFVLQPGAVLAGVVK